MLVREGLLRRRIPRVPGCFLQKALLQVLKTTASSAFPPKRLMHAECCFPKNLIRGFLKLGVGVPRSFG